MLWSFLFGSLFVAAVLFVGMAGFRVLKQLSWLDSFYEASMFFGGLGSEYPSPTAAAKVFSSAYAILCPFALVAAMSILVLPLLHRFLHKFHIESGE